MLPMLRLRPARNSKVPPLLQWSTTCVSRPSARISLAAAIASPFEQARPDALASVLGGAQLVAAPGQRVRLCVQDDGAGASEPQHLAGFGLLGLRERAQLVGGHVSIRTAPAQGFALELEVPG